MGNGNGSITVGASNNADVSLKSSAMAPFPHEFTLLLELLVLNTKVFFFPCKTPELPAAPLHVLMGEAQKPNPRKQEVLAGCGAAPPRGSSASSSPQKKRKTTTDAEWFFRV